MLALCWDGVGGRGRGPHHFELGQRSSLRHSILTSLLVRERGTGGREGSGDVCLRRKGNRWPRHSIHVCKGCRRCRVPIKSICPSVRDAGLQRSKHCRRVAGPSGLRGARVAGESQYCYGSLCMSVCSPPARGGRRHPLPPHVVRHLKHVRNL